MIAVLDKNAASFANWLYQSLIEAYERAKKNCGVRFTAVGNSLWHQQLKLKPYIHYFSVGYTRSF